MLVRIITGIVGIGLAAFVIQAGGTLFAVCGLVLALGAWFEYCNVFDKKGYRPALVIGGLFVSAMCYAAYGGLDTGLLTMLSLGAVLVMFLLTVLLHGSFSVPSAAVSAAGVLYLGMSFAHLIGLRVMEHGMAPVETQLGVLEPGCALIWTALIGTWASDTFAYFAGSFLGRHKLCPSISPGKTVEGFVGGLIGTTASVAGLGVLFGFDVQVMAVLGLCICIIATLGDLVESVMKRYTGIKDSGHIIPGHGGIWDRFDSVIYTVPFVYYFVQFVALR
ncbi:MAG: phosphatidate cytidylyltransferase [Selenomonadaceae bacterium]|nr:phosphatidate cytidylyltransferase [Selenomonadaceae bacterium]